MSRKQRQYWTEAKETLETEAPVKELRVIMWVYGIRNWRRDWDLA
jgi:hypothetical protein